MKKKLSILLVTLILIVSCFTLVGCGNTPTTKVKIAVPDGAPALSVTQIVKEGIKLNDNQQLQLDINKPNFIIPEVKAGKVDIAILPTNKAYDLFKAAKASNATKYVMIGTATYGNLHILGKTKVTNLNDMVGNILYSIGKGAIPHKILEKVLNYNNIPFTIINEKSQKVSDKVNIIFKDDGPNVFSSLEATDDTQAFGLLGEPAVTVGQVKKHLVKCFDMQTLFKEATNSTLDGYPQAVVIVKETFLQNNKQVAVNFMKKMVLNINFIADINNKKPNPETQKNIITDILQSNSYGTKSKSGFPAPSIVGCNILVKSSKNAKEDVKYILTNIGETNIDDDFFYELAY